jgi:hypothetical protein
MSKTKQNYNMDLNDEASKLLEKALSSFDGIILGTQTERFSIKPRTPEVLLILFIFSIIQLLAELIDPNSFYFLHYVTL